MILPFLAPADVDAAIAPVREHLDRDGLLAYPTETVYGLGSAPSPGATHTLATLMGRPEGKPFLILVSSREMAESWGLVFTPSARALADAFWPGPLTLVLAGGEGRLPDLLRGPERGIAVRYTSHPGLRRLVAGLGYPITSTSANRPGGRPAPGPAAIARLFADEVASGLLLLLDGGVLGDVPPSTLVDCTGSTPQMIREGALPREELRRAVGRLAP
ncbi:MAG: L-threonylcarbamoyladenylate synthase [Gemmatimonadales bacterium]